MFYILVKSFLRTTTIHSVYNILITQKRITLLNFYVYI